MGSTDRRNAESKLIFCLSVERGLFLQQLDAEQVQAIREALNGQLVYGRENFKDKIEKVTNRAARRGKDGRPSIQEELASYTIYSRMD